MVNKVQIHRNATVSLPDEGVLGPAMRALPSDRMRLFVVAMQEYANSGGERVSQARAAEAAGYEGGTQALAVVGHRLAHDERVQLAMLEEARRRLGGLLPLASSVLQEILLGGKANEKIKAAEVIFNRAGLPAVTKQEHTVERKYSEDEKLQRAILLARTLGLDPRSLLGNIGYTDVPQLEGGSIPVIDPEPDAIDAEFIENPQDW